MRQLVQNGWMHHLGRHSVACFLTRGQLYISWERVRRKHEMRRTLLITDMIHRELKSLSSILSTTIPL